ncbi:ribonuclease P protein component [Sphingobium sp. BYY-5]|uniref:ribonuclease P protein component n=1 Tax=Sphingobium sp. BYY-5 TaxID=2926400 RepID=UPI001FA6FDF0|nr:ribonuclease P protein component [Sphingobium sp. BYY-5]MCI4591431.1 ribonuclease P protein component [Sphingobium sp. BYY-5]
MVRRADFLAANRGRRAPMPGFVLLVRERGDGDPAMRYGITVTKKVGGAVIRNRMKRRFRVLARELLPAHGVAGADHVLIGRDGGIERDFSLLHAELTKALGKIMTRPLSSPARGGSDRVTRLDPTRPKGVVEGVSPSRRAVGPTPSGVPSGRHLPASGEE